MGKEVSDRNMNTRARPPSLIMFMSLSLGPAEEVIQSINQSKGEWIKQESH